MEWCRDKHFSTPPLRFIRMTARRRPCACVLRVVLAVVAARCFCQVQYTGSFLLWPAPLLHRSAISALFAMSPEVEVEVDSSPVAVEERMKKRRQLYLRACWTTYLATGRGSCALFEAATELGKAGFGESVFEIGSASVTVAQLDRFFEIVGTSGVRSQALEMLAVHPKDQPMNFDEFQSLLITATKFGAGRGSRLRRAYESFKQRVVGTDQKDDDKTYSLSKNTMSQSLRRMRYAVRGEVVTRADELQQELNAGVEKPFKSITYTNIGNPHAVGQKPLTFNRQVLALCDLPAESGVDHPEAERIFPKDAIARARELRASIGTGGTGSYTNSQGLVAVRQEVAAYIQKRDGHPSSAGDIFLTNGASSGIESLLKALIASDTDAIMIPIPQYPLYSALIALLGGRQVGYELQESDGWAVSMDQIRKQLNDARNEGLSVRALAIINPGNPTGQVLSAELLAELAKFCAEEGIVLLADEVYQTNIYTEDRPFTSAKKAAFDAGVEGLELVSFHSTSKGLLGECGRRGGYMELVGIDPYVKTQLYKLASSGLCAGVAGQIMMSLMVRPPAVGDHSYESHNEEEQSIFQSLKRRAKLLVSGLNGIDGITCNDVEGAMYAFPDVEVPSRAVQQADEDGISVDTLYALSLLEGTGICVVPASGFGQREGRVGFRTTFLPPEGQLEAAIKMIEKHHTEFVQKYS